VPKIIAEFGVRPAAPAADPGLPVADAAGAAVAGSAVAAKIAAAPIVAAIEQMPASGIGR
jgi:hypothetical protein